MKSSELLFQSFAQKQSALFASLAGVGQQIASGRTLNKLSIQPIKNPRAVIFIGMGGSTLGAHLISSLYREELTVPVLIENSYSLPACANSKTLVVLSSYSGTTEEVLTAYAETVQKKLPCLVLAGGGELLARAKKDGQAYGQLETAINPSKQPRLGVGLSLSGALAVLGASGVLKNSANKISVLAEHAKSAVQRYLPEVPIAANPAKKFAQIFLNIFPILVASEHLIGNCHLLQNQIHESAKHFAAYFPLSELNHHLMEGLSYPHALTKELHFFFIGSKNYTPQMIKRYPLTAEVVKKQGADWSQYDFSPQVSTKEEEAMDLLVFGGYLSSYLAALHGVIPGEIPWVDYFKKQMTTA